MTEEELAREFHETYERLAPSFGYKTREASAKPWEEVPEQNRRLMVAVCGEILHHLAAAVAEEREACALAVEMFGTSRPLTGYGDLQERLAGIIRGRTGS